MFAVMDMWHSTKLDSSEEFVFLNRSRVQSQPVLIGETTKGPLCSSTSTRLLFVLLINSNCPIKDNLLHSHALAEPSYLTSSNWE